MKPPARVTVPEAFREEHDVLRSALERLVSSPTSAEIAAFRQLLSAHFAREEGPDGVFDWLIALDPEIEGTVATLVEDHRALLRALDRLEEDQGDVRAVAELLMEHEGCEYQALTRALGRPE